MSLELLVESLIKSVDSYRALSHLNIDESSLHLHEIRLMSRRLLSHFPKQHREICSVKMLLQGSNALRDMDVLITETIEKFAAGGQSQVLRELLLNEREHLNEKFLDLLDDEWDAARRIINALALDEDVSELGSLEFSVVQKKLSKALKVLAQVDTVEKDAHKIRLKLKRYAHQILTHFPEKLELRTLLEDVIHRLGQMHDLYQSARLLQKFVDCDDLANAALVKKLQRASEQRLNEIKKQARSHQSYVASY